LITTLRKEKKREQGIGIFKHASRTETGWRFMGGGVGTGQGPQPSLAEHEVRYFSWTPVFSNGGIVKAVGGGPKKAYSTSLGHTVRKKGLKNL